MWFNFMGGYDYDLFKIESINEDDVHISTFSILMQYVERALMEISEMIQS